MATGVPNQVIIVDKNQSQSFQVEAVVASGGAATIPTGTPAKKNVSTTQFAIPMVDADGTTSQLFSGIAKSTSTDTAAASGLVQLWAPVPGLIYRGNSKTASSANTQALIDGLLYKRVIFDLTGSNWSVDDAASNADTNCLVILGGIPTTSEIFFAYAVTGTAWGNTTTA